MRSKKSEVKGLEKEKLTKGIKRLLEDKIEILFSYLHGSFMEDIKFNDIDVAIYVDENMVSREKAMDYEFALSDELEDAVKLPVDVKVINYAPLAFQYHATAGKILTCRDEEFMADKVAGIRSLYLDFKPVADRFLMEMLSG